jgi:protein gp37
MAATPQHTCQLLTKRSTRLRRIAPQLPWPPNVWMGVSVEDTAALDRVDDPRDSSASLPPSFPRPLRACNRQVTVPAFPGAGETPAKPPPLG